VAEAPKNLVASVRQRLMNVARSRGEDFQYILTQYGLERLLYRVSQSMHSDAFVLKGAQLFQLWSDKAHRATRDLDLLGKGAPSTTHFEQVFREICSTAVESDGLTFLAGSVQAAAIKEEDEYQGLRIRIDARLGNARIPLQIDIGFGDVVTPAPIEISYPVLLDFPGPNVRAYPRETVVAEKFQAMVMLGMANSRMKDFFDLWTLARKFEFEGPLLCRALEATFERRRTALPTRPPLALTAEFSNDSAKGIQWEAFLRKGNLGDAPASLADVTALLHAFLMPPVEALTTGGHFGMQWKPGDGWRSDSAV
jgi:predicted nucleotidyltransferase component of viral defense system